jgi:hypothetical protein
VGDGILAQENSLTLTDAELEDLTRKKRPSAQARALRFMGIEHRPRPDGSVAVDRSHYEEVMCGRRTRKTTPKRFEINWGD